MTEQEQKPMTEDQEKKVLSLVRSVWDRLYPNQYIGSDPHDLWNALVRIKREEV